jgi:hypothetical protein
MDIEAIAASRLMGDDWPLIRQYQLLAAPAAK